MNQKRIIASVLALALTFGVGTAVGANGMNAIADLFGDINADGDVNAGDAADILQYAAYKGSGGSLELKAWLSGAEDTPQVEPPSEEFHSNVPDTGDQLTVLCWTDADLANMLDVYDKSSSVSFVKVGDYGADAREKYVTYLNSGEDADILILESDWVSDYIDDDAFTLPLSDIGIRAEEYENAYGYTLELGTASNGVLKAASWQCTPGGYAYNADIAKEYLGINTPEEMQESISDWDKFEQTAAKLHDATSGNVTMTATIGGMWQAYKAGLQHSWVTDGALDYTNAESFFPMAYRFSNAGYVDRTVSQWTVDWTDIGLEGKTLGYFYASWCLYDGAQLEQNGGNAGNWRLVKGPQEFYWGGSSLAVASSCDNASLAADFIRSFTLDDATMKEYAEYCGDFVNNKKVMQEIIDEGGYPNPLLGGQDHLAVLADAADHISLRNRTKYDMDLNDAFISGVLGYMSDSYTEQQILNAIKSDLDVTFREIK